MVKPVANIDDILLIMVREYFEGGPIGMDSIHTFHEDGTPGATVTIIWGRKEWAKWIKDQLVNEE